LGAPDQHGTSGELITELLQLSGVFVDIGSQEMGRDEIAQHLEPEDRHLCEDEPFPGDAVGQDAIECGNPVGRYDKEAFAKVEDVADLSGGETAHAFQMGLEEDCV
jgi:hypothetical protein